MVDRIAGFILLFLGGFFLKWAGPLARFSALQWKVFLRLTVSDRPYRIVFIGIALMLALAGGLLIVQKISIWPLIRALRT